MSMEKAREEVAAFNAREEGYRAGQRDGYREGYADGFNDAARMANQKIRDLVIPTKAGGVR